MFVFYVLVVTVDTSVPCDREIIPRQVNRFPDRRRDSCAPVLQTELPGL